MRTLEQIAAAAKRKGVMFQIEEKTTPWEPYGCGVYDICLASKFDGHCSSSWFVFDPENKNYPLVQMDARTPTETERLFAERLAFRCSNFHECDWTF